MSSTFRRVAASIVRAVFPKVAYPVFRGPLRGARFILGALSGKGYGSSVYFNLVERKQTLAIEKTVTSGQAFFDIGANVGYYSILASRLVGPLGKVVAIEPSVRNVAYLYRHKLLNGAANLMIVSAACSDRAGLSCFSQGTNFAEGHLDLRADTGRSPLDRTVVPTVSVDGLTDTLKMYPDVLKIDVEGAELSVLRGAEHTLRISAPVVFLSIHSSKLRASCLNYLGVIGYRLKALDGEEHNASQFMLWHKENHGDVGRA